MAKATGNSRSIKNKATKKTPQARSKMPTQAAAFSVLERNILKSKGVSAAQIKKMIQKGIRCRDDFKQVGDAETLAALADVSPEAAAKAMAWALGAPVPLTKDLVVESSDVVHCVHCGTKQPKDYKSGRSVPLLREAGRAHTGVLLVFLYRTGEVLPSVRSRIRADWRTGTGDPPQA